MHIIYARGSCTSQLSTVLCILNYNPAPLPIDNLNISKCRHGRQLWSQGFWIVVSNSLPNCCSTFWKVTNILVNLGWGTINRYRICLSPNAFHMKPYAYIYIRLLNQVLDWYRYHYLSSQPMVHFPGSATGKEGEGYYPILRPFSPSPDKNMYRLGALPQIQMLQRRWGANCSFLSLDMVVSETFPQNSSMPFCVLAITSH